MTSVWQRFLLIRFHLTCKCLTKLSLLRQQRSRMKHLKLQFPPKIPFSSTCAQNPRDSCCHTAGYWGEHVSSVVMKLWCLNATHTQKKEMTECIHLELDWSFLFKSDLDRKKNTEWCWNDQPLSLSSLKLIMCLYLENRLDSCNQISVLASLLPHVQVFENIPITLSFPLHLKYMFLFCKINAGGLFVGYKH